ncbi:hypothetical protein LCGC14_3018810, partial [marine sediment metagenome]
EGTQGDIAELLSFNKHSRRQIGIAQKNADKITNAVMMLPAMNKLVREMYEVLKENDYCRAVKTVMRLGQPEEVPFDNCKRCSGCMARRLVERMEGGG